eukprot:gnl/TRDRNA2_/TRDRNA2_173567_c0_seq1.p1 gnl/TRDRNA2_/TRDRNA2_173567_c0~~gnl/TRDRNA2_/TRDRNA2_173567_c0_seq1.p1  ORF type:complete len:700 (+),score=134.24 gnl/TRDRNA2_/TRDRNA2_173567_c0_seq1:108-2207(+)
MPPARDKNPAASSPRPEDLEGQGNAAGSEPLVKKASSTSDTPLLLGRWAVPPEKLFNYMFGAYIVFFVVHRVADIAYLLTVDARFPPGLGHLYPSEAERLQSVAYTRETVLCSMLAQTCIFIVVFALVWFGWIAKADQRLKQFLTSVHEHLANSRCGPCCGTILGSIRRCTCHVCAGLEWCCCWACRQCGMGPLPAVRWAEIFRGCIFLTLFAALFFLITVPFRRWYYEINVKFGFVNTLMLTSERFNYGLVAEFLTLFTSGIFMRFLFLFMLQFHFGWVAMWLGLMIPSTWAAYNMDALAPSMGLKNPMPSEPFAVGRGFPLVSTLNEQNPWVSLNRIYFRDTRNPAPVRFVTRDLSIGQLNLTSKGTGMNGPWEIASRHIAFGQRPYAETATSTLLGSEEEHWGTNVQYHGDWKNSIIGLREGGKLRNEVFGFGREHNVDVGEVYFLDGSHIDARANAFVAGAGKKKIIGLYDTLFLGEHQQLDTDSSSGDVQEDFFLQRLAEKLQDVDISEEAPRPVWHSADTSAMTDTEILSILAHELGHSHFSHIEKGMVVQAVTSFITFAALGFMAHDPVVAAAFALAAPVVHVGAFAYDHVVGPPLEGFIKLFTDAMTRSAEYEADAYTARVSKKLATGLQTALVKVTVNSNQDPNEPWFYSWLHADHPSTSKRWAYIEKVKRKKYGYEPPGIVEDPQYYNH